MDSAQEVLIAIASASQRVIDALLLGARDSRNERNLDLSHKQLGGDLHRVVAASRTLLAETFEHSSSTDPAIDDRLEMWLSSGEPATCLDTLQEMETLIKSSSNGIGPTLRNIFLPAPIEGKFKQAIQIFKKNRVHFYFLLNTNVWNHETVIMGQPKRHLVDTRGTRQDLVARNVNSVEPSWKKRIWSEMDWARSKEILEWLNAWDCTEKHEDTLELRQRDTCTWLPDTDEYQTWRYSNDAFLWLHGKPGSGKSVLAASVIDGIQNTMDKGELLAFFYCDFRSERSTVAAEVMRSLLSQLFQGLGDLGLDPGDIPDVLAKERRQKHTIIDKSKRLAVLVSRIAKKYPRPPIVAIDALDECEDIENLLDSLLGLDKGGVRLLVFSRPLQVIKYRFSGLPWLSLEQMSREVYADINLHVRREVDSHSRLRDVRIMLKEEIIGRLCREADGMFRWVECQLNTLKRCFTTSEIRDVLDSLPVGLDATYQRILLMISKEERGGVIAKRALTWIITALRPLRLCEVVEALSIDLDMHTLNLDSAPVHGRALLDSLSSLVIHSEEADIVRLSHFSVMEYLAGNFMQENHMYHINLRDAHVQVAQQCMSYISSYLTLGLQDSNEHPFIEYALDCGFHHLSYVEPTDQILDSIVVLHRDVQQHPLEWEQLRKGDRADELPSHQHDFVLYILIRYAPNPLLDLFLCRSPVAEKEGINPLIYAVPWKVEHACTLLAHGVKLGFSGQFSQCYNYDFLSGLPIEAAVKADDWGLVDLFLEEGSPVPHRLFSTQLFGGSEHTIAAHVLTRLLQTDEFMEWAIDVLDKQLFTPTLLHGLAKFLDSSSSASGDMVMIARRLKQIGCDLAGHVSFVEALLRHAASSGDIFSIQYLLSDSKIQLPPNIFPTGNTSRLASFYGQSNAEMIHFLIQHGADIHVVSDADESTVLHYTVELARPNCLEQIKLLCEAGCSPSVCNLQGQASMHIAVKRSDLSAVRNLLSIGASLPPDILFVPYLSSSMIRFLLGNGADVGVVAANGDSALHSALRYTSTDDSVECLECARMLISAGCDLRITDSSGQTSLHIAVANGHISVVKYLLSLNIAPLPRDILLSALAHRRCYHHSDSDRANILVMVRLLLKHGASPDVNTPDGDNALHLATSASAAPEDKGYRVVKILVAAGCDPSACNSNGRTVLHTAAASGYMGIMEYLLSLDALIPSDILLFLSYGRTTVTATQVIQLLIDKGADVRAVTADGDTPLHRAVISSYPESSSLKFAELLIAAGSDPRAFSMVHKTPMHAAAARGYISVVNYLLSLGVPLPPDILLTVAKAGCTTLMVRFLIDKGADTTAITAEGDTALHLALRSGFGSDLLETTKILIGAGCDINVRNSAGDTPLYAAASGRGRLDIIKYLLSQGVSLPTNILLAAAKHGDIDTMEYLLSQGTSVPPSVLLAAASYEGYFGTSARVRLKAIRFLSTLDGADIHAVGPNGDTALHCAVEHGNWNSEDSCLEAAKLLVHLGCHLSLCNSAGETPIHIAARRHYISVLKYLLSQGAPLPSDVLLSAVFQTASILDDGAKAGAMICLLIREGANPCVVNDKGDTPLHVLLRRNFHGDTPWDFSDEGMVWEWKVVQMLLDAGANPYARNLDGQTPVDLVERLSPYFTKNFMRLVEQAMAPIAPRHN